MSWVGTGGEVVRRVVIGDLRVQRIDRTDGRRSWTIVWPEGTVHEEADQFLRVHEGSGTQKTYAYYLVDHLRWLERECLAFGKVQLRDLERYMGIVGAGVRMPLGEPWRTGKRQRQTTGQAGPGGWAGGVQPAWGPSFPAGRAWRGTGQAAGAGGSVPPAPG
jgi:hypothetical protein